MEDEAALLGGESRHEASTEKRMTMNYMTAILNDESVGNLTESEIDAIDRAVQKLQLGVQKARENMITDDDILGVDDLQIASPLGSIPPLDSEVCDELILEAMEADIPDDDDLDYDEYIAMDQEEMEQEIEEARRRLSEENSKPFDVVSKYSAERSNESTETSESRTPVPASDLTRESTSPFVRTYRNYDSHSSTSNHSEQSYEIRRRPRIVYDLPDDDNRSSRSDSSQCARSDRSEENVSQVEFSKKLSEERPYLRMERADPPIDFSIIKLSYPLGVTYDSPSESWFFTNCDNYDPEKNVLVQVYTGRDPTKQKIKFIKDPKFTSSPTAITILEEGRLVAFLCSMNSHSPYITVYNIQTGELSMFVHFKDDVDFVHQARGLARSRAGNLLTMDMPRNSTPRLRLFSKHGTMASDFKLPQASCPSFIATNKSTVVITDLGRNKSKQTVMHIRLDDTKDETDFAVLRVIDTAGVHLRDHELLDKQYFKYVAGAQIDRKGNIIIADAGSHHFKLFKPTMGFIHRVSTDFPVPFISSFHVNQHGEVLMLDIRSPQHIHFARLTASNRLQRHIPAVTLPRKTKGVLSRKKVHSFADHGSPKIPRTN